MAWLREENAVQIIVDADACPVRKIIVNVAKKYHIVVVMISDTAHYLRDGYSRIVTVDKGADSVDFALMGTLKAGDVVVTQDYGLAAMALGKGAKVINQNGMVYTNGNIDWLLMERHEAGKVRRSGGRTKGASKRNAEDDERFEAALIGLLEVC